MRYGNCEYHLNNPIEETDDKGRTIHRYCGADKKVSEPQLTPAEQKRRLENRLRGVITRRKVAEMEFYIRSRQLEREQREVEGKLRELEENKGK